MEIFDEDIHRLRQYVEAKRGQGRAVRSLASGKWDQGDPDFLTGEAATIVLREDTWLELGNPATRSSAPVLVTENLDLVRDGAITLIGADIPEVRTGWAGVVHCPSPIVGLFEDMELLLPFRGYSI